MQLFWLQDPQLLDYTNNKSKLSASPPSILSPKFPSSHRRKTSIVRESSTREIMHALERYHQVPAAIAASSLSDHVRAVLLILYYHHPRIAELQQLTRNDALDDSTILVRGLKGSRSTTISHHAVALLLRSVTNHPSDRLVPYGYKVYARAARSVGMCLLPKAGHQYNRVLHSPRTIIAESVRTKTHDVAILRDTLRHNSNNAQDNYNLGR